ncbi:MAG TPA: ABC transporter permease, partial [Candidatus Aphodovivens avistercoris]|nr:ABC transporter permease [Candidatus Aphodovivens avistercoris]
MLSFAIRQIIRCALLVLAVSFVTFALVSAAPVDPLQANLGQSAYLSMTAGERAELAAYWGTDQPFLERYLGWLGAF